MTRFLASGVAAVLMCAAVVLDQMARQPMAFGSTSRLLYVLGAAAVGALILRRHPGHAVGKTFSGVALAAAANSAASDYARLNVSAEGLALWLGWFGSWSWFVEIGLLVIALPLLFPNGRLLSRRWSTVGWAGAVAVALLCVHAALAPGPLEMLPGVDNPFAVGAEQLVLLAEVGFAAFFFAMCGAIASLIVRFRRASGTERQQMKWLVSALVLFACAFAFAAMTFRPDERYVIAEIAIVATGTLIPVAAGIAILRYRLYDIDVLINRTLVYGVVSATLAVTYFAGLVLLQRVFSPLTQGSDIAVALSTLAVAALFQPVRTRAQRFVDRRFYRHRYDASKTIDAFAARLRQEVDLDEMSSELVSVVRQTVQPAHVSLWLRAPAERLR